MEKNEFKSLCKKMFYKYGLVKIKNGYFLENEDYVLSIFFQSSYAATYYVNFCFSVKGYNKNLPNLEEVWDTDFSHRIMFPAIDGDKRYLSGLFEYGKFTVEETEPYFDVAFNEWILPIFREGKKNALKNIRKFFGPPENILYVRKGLYEYLLKEAAM
ncbi:MAG: hypothetical protein A2Y20_08405 [Firmicutes bacterium GWF2_51_9]|nr:MAG: hypothetical protein A2Y20_08405 [Firmicutes bacterium GWF2_51_9]OGS59710.1 MAG: hypothetical protein A2Y19_02205 [Firmicutes bacterium GWE2_51_13]HAM64075.1 hypothetical protein [Erysipelotrichaceae bacterium]HBZ42230.1 hypothetical protein [Erysipelotrichaceae bacterium]